MALKPWIKTLLYILAFVVLISLFEWYGIVGFIIFILVITGKRIYDGRESIKIAMRGAETTIWGKPLDKNLWDKGELKQRRVKFVWKKKGKK